MNLNPQQLEAVHHKEGPLLILAGAGSGKTRVITQRIVHLIRERGVLTHQVLAVTFTNKAAEEMRHRVASLLGAGSSALWISTFHSACVRILRGVQGRVGLVPNNFVIYDDDDSITLIKECLEELKIEERGFPPRAVYSRLAGAKNELVSPQAYATQASDFFESRVAEVYQLYQKKLEQNGALDFGDLIFRVVTLFQTQPDILQSYRDRWHYILIDEYQDTNRAQYVLTRLLSEPRNNLCVVGDDDQSIYRWRGADIQNILNFEADYPGCKVIRLEQNYRSTQNVLTLANHVISNNHGRKGKNLWTSNGSGDPATLYGAHDERDEARFVIQQVQKMVNEEGRRYTDFAIFYRTNAQSRTFEEELRRNRIPYTIFGGMKFYDRREVKDILAYLRILINPKDSLNLKRILNVPPRGLGAKAVSYLEDFASKGDPEGHPYTLYEAIDRLQEIPGIPSLARNRIQQFHNLVESWKRSLESNERLAALTRRIMEESGYMEMLRKEKTMEAEGRLENLEELLNVVNECEAPLSEFLDQVALVGQTDNFDAEKGVLPMMTLHLAKGLEFPIIFLVGMEENLFPHSRSIDSPEEIEEERRLCYVGLTRARERIFMTLASRRHLYGGDQFNPPSRFLEEMPEELIDKIECRGATNGTRFLDEDADDWHFDQRSEEERPEKYRIGISVQHPTFGVGIVKRREGAGDQQKITVYFNSGQIKTLMVKFANLSVLG